MNIKISPYKSGQEGYLCHPLCNNLPDADKRHPDWRRIQCPVCGCECWESDRHRKIKEQEPMLRAACTACAVKRGMQG